MFKHQRKVNRVQAGQVKVMLTVFFDSSGVVHHEYAPHGQTITKEYYLEVLRCLRDAVRRKLWATKTWKLHHDNAPAHSAHLIQSFLAKNNTPLVRQAPYSPDMAPSDFWLFYKLKMPLTGTRFQEREDIKQNTTADLNSITKDAFQICFEQRQKRREYCVHHQ